MLHRRELLSLGCALGVAALFKGVEAQTAMGGAAPAPPQGAAATISDEEILHYVNPELRAVARQMLAAGPPNGAPGGAPNGPSGRQPMPVFPPLLASPVVEQKQIPGAPGAPPVTIYVAGATPGASKPAVLHIHGGGYITGSAATSRRQIQDLVNSLDCVAVTVEYRLAPGTHFPGSLEDNYAALRWLYSNAKDLGVDTSRIAIKGESAGGGHAAALAIAARDRREFPICYQVLIYPMLDDRTGATRQVPPFVGRFIWTADRNRFGWTSLLGVPAGSDQVPPNSVPARVENVAGLPPAFIGVGSIDLFCEEDIAYANRLIAAGIATEMIVVPGAFHAFDGVAPQAEISVEFTSAWHSALKRAFTES